MAINFSIPHKAKGSHTKAWPKVPHSNQLVINPLKEKQRAASRALKGESLMARAYAYVNIPASKGWVMTYKLQPVMEFKNKGNRLAG